MRRRPGLYLGGANGFALHSLAEVVLRSGAVAARERGTREVSLRMGADGSCTAVFDGWSCPAGVEAMPEEVEGWLALTSYDPRGTRPEGVARGLVLPTCYDDLAMVSVFSSSLDVRVWGQGRAWGQRFREGIPQGGMRPEVLDVPASDSGLRLVFTPDASLFAEPPREVSEEVIRRMRELAALVPGVLWRFHDAPSGREERVLREQGLADLCRESTASSGPLHEPWSFEGLSGTTRFRLAMQWCERPGEGFACWGNLQRCSHRDIPREGLRRGLHEAVSARRAALGYRQVKLPFSKSALATGLTAVMELVVPVPIWHRHTHDRLETPEVESAVAGLVAKWVEEALARSPELEARLLPLAAVRAPSMRASRR
ncbi:DNA gyrase subunit B [Myxococcus sp. CA039A]|uniref:DNA gyrase subunit B n=1 Tax=Myxococcus sp. CA039A TaxID=2741737 RepID=UPI00157AF46B|nr:DNA gyrase subunit B [Myxococcus sp. CA039A]NTX57254.1 DNA gyrase subunit B [Myxococcus sp. CA039A]